MNIETEYFGSKEVSVLVDLTLKLAAELNVCRQRTLAIELALTRQKIFEPGAIDHFRPDGAEAERLAADRDALMSGLMDIMTESELLERPLRDQWDARLAADQ